MAKELPFFKFEPGAWDNGNIQMCSRESKGLFADLCSLYWSRLGELPYALALQKLCNGNESALQELKKHEIIGVVDGQIHIEFLDEQLEEFSETSEKRRNAANKRWKDASALQVESKSNAIRGEKRREEKKRKDSNTQIPIGDTKEAFYKTLVPHVEKYGKEMVREFYEYWTEPSQKGKKLRFESQRFFDVSRRLSTWAKNQKDKPNGSQVTIPVYKPGRRLGEGQ